MKVVQINTFPSKSTGHIMMNIHKVLMDNGFDAYVCWGRGRMANNNREIVIEDRIGVMFHGIYTRLFDRTGFASWHATKKLLRKLEKIEPDIIHLHNIHGYYLNIEMLFNYIREHNIKVVWTLHDCWALTGHCAWFDMCGCEKWKRGCYCCEQLDTYPISKCIDSSKWNWEKKKKLFSGLNMVIVTPSEWLKHLVMKSYLNKYPVKVIHNGIDLKIFKPSTKEQVKKCKKKYNLDSRKIVLGVASEWTERKGLKDFCELSKIMKDIQFVVVGLTKQQLKIIPDSVKGIERTENQNELAVLYTMADIFFNPTYEDNFPTTNLEALACGTPIITYDTGGSVEVIEMYAKKYDSWIGEIIVKETAKSIDYNRLVLSMKKALCKLENRETKNEIFYNCYNAAKKFESERCLNQYIDIYKSIVK